MISTCSYSELNWYTACEEIIKHDSSIKRITSYTRSFSQKQQIHTCLSALAAWYVFLSATKNHTTCSIIFLCEQVSVFSSAWQCFVLEYLICDVLVDPTLSFRIAMTYMLHV